MTSAEGHALGCFALLCFPWQWGSSGLGAHIHSDGALLLVPLLGDCRTTNRLRSTGQVLGTREQTCALSGTVMRSSAGGLGWVVGLQPPHPLFFSCQTVECIASICKLLHLCLVLFALQSISIFQRIKYHPLFFHVWCCSFGRKFWFLLGRSQKRRGNFSFSDQCRNFPHDFFFLPSLSLNLVTQR